MGPFTRLRQAQPLYEQLAELVRQKVASGELCAGQRLPSEMELASSLGVSRPSVREAIKILQALGVVNVRHGAGIYVTTADAAEIVRRLTPSPVLPPEELEQVYEVRKVLECQAAAWAARQITPAGLALLRQVVAQMRELVESAGATASPPPLDRLEQLDSQFHAQLTLLTSNAVLIGLMDNMRGMVRESRRYSLSIPGRAIQSVYDHQHIFAAIAAGRPLAAARAMFAHLDGVQRSVFRIQPVGEPSPAEGSTVIILSYKRT